MSINNRKMPMKPYNRDSEVLLLETPFLSQTGTEEVRAYVQSKYNLALLALGSYIKAHSNLKVSLINMVKDRITETSLMERLRKNPPAVVGASLYSYSLSLAYKLITRIKQEFPETHICVGGPHVNIFPRETIRLEHIDSIVLGDGELPFLEICKQIVQDGKLNQNALPPGTYTKESLTDNIEMQPHILKDLDSLPLPDLSLLGDYRRYRDFLSNKVMALLSASRGCPFVCHYCWSEKSRYRSFSVEHMIGILHYYKEMEVEYVEFWDETFNPNKKRLAYFAEALLDADLGLPWTIRGAVVNHVPLDTLLKLKKTGLRIIQFGIETGSPRLLKYLNKRIERKQIKEAFENCRRAGIRTVANLIINIPTQTKNEILDDFEMLKQVKPTYVSISIYNWAPGTTLYENALKNKTLLRDFWRDYAANPIEPEPVTHAVTEIPIDEVYKLRSQFVNRYYFNIPYIFNYLKVTDFSEIKRAISISWLMSRSRVINISSGFKNLIKR